MFLNLIQVRDIHFWTKCKLACRTYYARFETLNLGLFDEPIAAGRAQ